MNKFCIYGWRCFAHQVKSSRSGQYSVLVCYNVRKNGMFFRYYPWSFIYSPGWVQIKCELRILSQLSFNLNPDWELPAKREANNQPLKDGVRDMLVKHHLFSWDI